MTLTRPHCDTGTAWHRRHHSTQTWHRGYKQTLRLSPTWHVQAETQTVKVIVDTLSYEKRKRIRDLSRTDMTQKAIGIAQLCKTETNPLRAGFRGDSEGDC